jgi:WD repeat-containing protein 61
LQREQNAHEDNIWAVGWTSKDGLLTGSVDESCKQWSYESDKKGFTERKHITGQELGVVGLDVNPSGDLAAISTLDCFIRLLNLKNNEDQVGISLTSPETWSLAFNPQPEANQLAVAAGCKGGIRLYRTNVLESEDQREICHLAAQPHGKSKDSQKPFALGCAYHPSGSKVACSHSDGHIALYDLEAQKHAITYVGHNKPVRDLCFSPDGKFLISACDDNTCNLYDIGNKVPIGSLNGHDSSVLCIVANEGGHCITGSSDSKIKLWDLSQRTCIQTVSEHQEAVWDLSYQPETQQLASVSDDASICIYKLN